MLILYYTVSYLYSTLYTVPTYILKFKVCFMYYLPATVIFIILIINDSSMEIICYVCLCMPNSLNKVLIASEQ